MFAKLITSRAPPTAPSAPAEHAPTRTTRSQEGANASVFARTLKKLKLSPTCPRSDDKSTQLKHKAPTNTVVPIQALASALQDLPNQPQDRDHRSPPNLRKSPAVCHPSSQARPRNTSRSTGRRSSTPANPGSGKSSTAPRLSPRERTTTPSSHLRAPQAGAFNLDRSLAAAAAQQLRVEVVRPTAVVDSTSHKPSPKPAVARAKTHRERRRGREERSRSWDWRFESEMARQRYSATEEDLEKLAEEADLDEPPESLLQFWKKSTTHEDRRLSWDPTWEPEMHQLRHSVTSEDLRRLDEIRRKTAWLQPHPPKSPKAKRTFKWFGAKKAGGQGRPEGLRFY